MASVAKYDQIGKGYDLTREPDPFILSTLRELLEPVEDGVYLDLACGSCNYTSALSMTGDWFGLDQSSLMLQRAIKKTTGVGLARADVGQIPFADDSFDGTVCTLAIHHFPSLRNSFGELRRVQGEGRFVLFTSTADQMKGYWLCEYFPDALEASISQMPTHNRIIKALSDSGFRIVSEVPYFVAEDLKDSFLYSGKHDPARYLSASFRNGISTFTSLADPREVENGCARLKEDIESGKVNEVIEDYSNDLGDYLFVVSE